MAQSSFGLRGRNPDVLTCIANLSNDEVFTPPELANQILDTVAEAWAARYDGANIWADRSVRFLDPCTKSGVFIREITSRLTEGLKDAIPDLQERVSHILTKQVFGIGITQITGLLARRSAYCSKLANGKHSIAEKFTSEDGNIWFERIEHTWEGNKCRYCNAPKVFLNRDAEIENYAYPFIHTSDIGKWVSEKFGGNMQFDVVIGNPPYQMKGGAGGTNDSPIYHLFVEQAKRLEPKFLAMVIPSRWLAGGRGLDEFRKEMLGSHNLVSLVDHPISSEVFPGVQVEGGVCYFLREASHYGPCHVTVVRGGDRQTAKRQLDEFDVFVRDPKAVQILQKVLSEGGNSITEILTADTPFGLATNFNEFRANKGEKDVALHYVRHGKRSVGYLRRDLITKNSELIDQWKVLAPKAHGGGQIMPSAVLGKPLVSRPPSVCTQTFLAFAVDSKTAAESLESYYRTKFFRFLVSLRKLTQDALRSTYTWVPQQTWDREWTDKELYKKYKLTKDDIAYIELVIRPMESSDE